MKLDQLRRYTLKEISDCYGISISTLKWRCFKNNLVPIKHNGLHQFALTFADVYLVIDKDNENPFQEIIYITRTTEILHSKLNFLTLEQL